MSLKQAAAVVRAYGLTVENWSDDPDENCVDTPEASFFKWADEDKYEVVMWSGSYPFVTEHSKGSMPSIEEAVRYAVWLIKRDDFYQERDEAKWRDLEDESRRVYEPKNQISDRWYPR